MKNNAPHLKSIFLSPAVLPAASFLTAAALEAQPLLPLLLASLGLAFGRRFGAVVVFFALGLLVGHLRSDEPPRLDDLRRPIEIVAEVVSHPQRYDDTVSCLLRVERLLRAREVRRVSFDLRLSLAADLPGGPELCQRGGRLRLRGELRRTAAFANYEGARPGPWRMRLKSARLATVERSPGLLSRGPALLRARIDAALSSHDESIGVALARALLIGDRSGLKIAHQQSLRRFGLAHLLAVSGLHVGLLGGGVFLLASPLPRWARHGLAAAAILLYLMVLGPRPSALRAALMGWWMLTSLLAGRAPHALNSLACGVIVLVSIDPEMLLEPGFQLSVSATAGILLFSPIFVQRWTFLPYRLRQALAVSVAAQISTMPWSLPLTGAVHPLASVMNLLAVPWLTVVLGAAFIFLPVMLSPFSGLTEVLVFMLDFFAMPLDLLLRLPVTPLDLRLFSQNHMAAWILAMALALVALRPRTGGVIFLAGWLVFSIPETKPTVELTVLDVGQGDAIVLQDGTSAILIDGGGWPQGDFGGRVLVPALAAVGVRHVEAVIMTHPDTDHCGGLADLARYVAIG